MIQASKSPYWPDGFACELVAKLMTKYRQDDVMALAEMTTKLSKLKMGKNRDPEDLEDDIAAIQNEYCCDIDEKIRKAFAVKATGKYYADIRWETLCRFSFFVGASDRMLGTNDISFSGQVGYYLMHYWFGCCVNLYY